MATIEVRETGEYIIEKDTGRIFDVTRQVTEDGQTIAVHRRPIEPDADVSAEPQEVQDIAARVRTPERLARYAALVAASEDVTPTR